jgi:hypothetical protein
MRIEAAGPKFSPVIIYRVAARIRCYEVKNHITFYADIAVGEVLRCCMRIHGNPGRNAASVV